MSTTSGGPLMTRSPRQENAEYEAELSLAVPDSNQEVCPAVQSHGRELIWVSHPLNTPATLLSPRLPNLKASLTGAHSELSFLANTIEPQRSLS